MSFDFKPDEDDPMLAPVVAAVYAEPKYGKTSAVAHACPNHYWITTNPGALRPVAAKAKSTKLPTHKTILEFDSSGELFDTLGWLKAFCATWIAGCKAGTTKSAGVVIDEYSTVLARIFAQLQTMNGTSGRGPFKTIDDLKNFNRFVCALPRVTGKGLVLISHSQDPKFDDEEASPTRGKLRTPGGPKVPVQTMVREILQEMDAVVQISIVGGKRCLLVDPEPSWIRGIRGYNGPGKVEGTDLRALLESAGFQL